MTGALPLSGLVVLDLTLARAGPTAARHLADWGADVIRIEPPAGKGSDLLGRKSGSDYQNLHRNKRLITLDLKSEAGLAAFHKLVARADVLVENMRAPVKKRLKIAWEDLDPINPRLVYGSISGFGQSGPYAERACVDQVAQAMGGLMSITGEPGRGPMRAGIAISDMAAGTLLALSIMIALYERQTTGRGRWVHTSLLESQIFMLDFQAARYLATGDVPQQVGNNHPTAVPMGVFPTRDGHISAAASGQTQWAKLCEILGRPEWATREGWADQASRLANRDEVNAAISGETVKQPSAYWAERLDAAGLPCGPIYSVDQVFEDPQVRHLGVAASAADGRNQKPMIASPMNMEGVDKSIRTSADETAAHTREVLAWAGCTDAEINAATS